MLKEKESKDFWIRLTCMHAIVHGSKTHDKIYVKGVGHLNLFEFTNTLEEYLREAVKSLL